VDFYRSKLFARDKDRVPVAPMLDGPNGKEILPAQKL